MRKTVERELKLVPGEEFRLADLGEPLPPRVFVSTYHDTPDFRLAQHRITLRNRVEEGTRLWQLKIPSGASRIELELAGPPARPPTEMTDLLVVHLRGEQPLVKVARLRTRRQTVLKGGAEIVEDAVSVFEAQRVTRRFREVEVELLDGDERTLKSLERELRRAGAEPGTFTPKLYRALDLSFERDVPPVPSDAPPGERTRPGPSGAAPQPGRARPGHTPRLRPGGSPPDARRDPSCACVSAVCPIARGRRVGGAASRRARVARLGARPRARRRCPARARAQRTSNPLGRAPSERRVWLARSRGSAIVLELSAVAALSESEVLRASRSPRASRASAARRGNDDVTHGDVVEGVRQDEEGVRNAGQSVAGHRAACCSNPGQASPLLRRACGTRARQAGCALRGRGQEASGRPG